MKRAESTEELSGLRARVVTRLHEGFAQATSRTSKVADVLKDLAAFVERLSVAWPDDERRNLLGQEAAQSTRVQ